MASRCYKCCGVWPGDRCLRCFHIHSSSALEGKFWFSLFEVIMFCSQVGFTETYMSIILGVAPFLALFTVPSLGKLSDACSSRYGRRRPFIFSFSIILVFSLILLYIGQGLGTEVTTKPIRMLLLAVGVILLDYASQAAINPCEALMSDLLSGQQGEETGFTVYSGMLSVGACIGGLWM